MLYELFRQTEIEGLLHFTILVIILQKIFPEFKSPWNKISYYCFSLGSFFIIKYFPYLIPSLHYNRPYWYYFFISLPLSLLV